MSYRDLREFMAAMEARGELRRINGAHWELEMGGIAEIAYREGKEPKPAILFDEIPGYPKGYRTLFNFMGPPWKVAAALGLPEDQLDRMSLLRNWRKKTRELRLIPPRTVASGPVLENLMTGDQVDLFKFPSPRFHELDTPNRYIGTAVAVIQRDPDRGWVNSGTYRVMVVDCDRLTFHALEGQHGSIIMRKYLSQGRVMPVVVAIGVDPAFYVASITSIAWGVSEYDYAGGIMGEPMEVVEGAYTGIPLPATAEIVIEGECHPGETAMEGPFGEWHGYYGNLGLEKVPEPVIRVKAIHYRNNPVLTCTQITVPPHYDSAELYAITDSEHLWSVLETAGIPGIKGVWCHAVGCARLFNVISIEQLYTGHSQRVGLVASQLSGELGRYTVVVEDDIDPSDLEQVVWAMETRGMPTHDTVHILEHCHATSADPSIPLSEKKKYPVPPKPLYSSRVIIDTCRGMEHKDWYPIARISPELRTRLLSKWGTELSSFMK
ncbi:MAG: UbiD family decarboxylase [Chloroflexi bacterium]|nr:UbiD family decarboxylase [Chloroflexota bacterium]